MSKYNRHQPSIIRECDSAESEDHWLNQFAKNLEKTSVEPVKTKSIHEQISAIMNKKSKFPTVESAVLDMQERSGLKAYREKIKLSENESEVAYKKASDSVKLFVKVPAVKNTLENYIVETKGSLPVPAVVSKVTDLHKRDVADAADWDQEDFLRYVSDRNLEERNKHKRDTSEYMNLGKIDRMNNDDYSKDNEDAFSTLNPARK